MKKVIVGFALLSVCGFSVYAADAKPKDLDKTLYALGAMLGQNLDVFSLSKSELKQVEKGLSAAVNKEELAVKIEDYQDSINSLARDRMKVKADAELKEADKFIASKTADKSYKKLSNGAYIKVIKEGAGKSPTAEDVVTVHYVGTLRDGKEFDSSIKRDEPATFPLGNVIPCWTEGVQQIKEGGKAELVCPASTAYGERGRPPVIPGNATLVFQVELIKIAEPKPNKELSEMKAGAKAEAPATKKAEPKSDKKNDKSDK